MRFSIVAAALVAVLVGFGGTLAVIVQAAGHLGATPGQTASWVAALCLAIACTSIFLSLRYRMPIVTAWSLAGAVLIAAAPPEIDLPAATGAFLASAALTIVAGLVPALGGTIARLPASIAGAMLAGLLLRFVHAQTCKQPFELDIDDLDAPLIGAFLAHLERDRGNSARTGNARLGAIHSFYRYAALQHPEHAHTTAQIMTIPTKRYERSTVCYLDHAESAALLTAPDQATWLGRRDRALLALIIQTGVGVCELIGLRLRDVHLGTGRHVRVLGKGRKRRTTPLTGKVAALLHQWITERDGQPDDPLFPTSQGAPLSRFTVGLLVANTPQQRRSATRR